MYVVQPDDTLYSIAARFNVSINALMAANNISDPNLLGVGQQLVIPGLQGVSGVLDTEVINFGDSFHSLLRRTQIPLDLLRRLNHVVSPTEFYVGASLIVPKAGEPDRPDEPALQQPPGQSCFELAVRADTNPWMLSTLNGLHGTWDALPGDVLYIPAARNHADQNASGLPPPLSARRSHPCPSNKGRPARSLCSRPHGMTLSGTLVNYPLHFFPVGDGRMVALQGIHAMLEPGVYPLQLDATGRGWLNAIL